MGERITKCVAKYVTKYVTKHVTKYVTKYVTYLGVVGRASSAAAVGSDTKVLPTPPVLLGACSICPTSASASCKDEMRMRCGWEWDEMRMG